VQNGPGRGKGRKRGKSDDASAAKTGPRGRNAFLDDDQRQDGAHSYFLNDAQEDDNGMGMHAEALTAGQDAALAPGSAAAGDKVAADDGADVMEVE
jgi:hypothetical protein